LVARIKFPNGVDLVAKKLYPIRVFAGPGIDIQYSTAKSDLAWTLGELDAFKPLLDQSANGIGGVDGISGSDGPRGFEEMVSRRHHG
jgi:hypothetical protein